MFSLYLSIFSWLIQWNTSHERLHLLVLRFLLSSYCLAVMSFVTWIIFSLNGNKNMINIMRNTLRLFTTNLGFKRFVLTLDDMLKKKRFCSKFRALNSLQKVFQEAGKDFDLLQCFLKPGIVHVRASGSNQLSLIQLQINLPHF